MFDRVISSTRFWCFSFLFVLFLSSTRGVLAEGFVLDWPVDSQVITGYKTVYIDRTSGRECIHSGIDIGAEAGTPVKAAAEGVVCFAGYTPAGGEDSSIKNTISIEHLNGLRTTYLQIDDVNVSRGQNVARGQVIARVSASGDRSSVLPHLHLGLKSGDDYLDPQAYLTTVVARPPGEANADANPVGIKDLPTVGDAPSGISTPDAVPVCSTPLAPVAPGIERSTEQLILGATACSAPVPANSQPEVVPGSAAPLSQTAVLSAVLPVDQDQRSLMLEQEYLSSSETKEDLASTAVPVRAPRKEGTDKSFYTNLIAAAISAAICLALVQSFYPVVSSKISGLICSCQSSIADLFWKGG